jgi:hypothetical protein
VASAILLLGVFANATLRHVVVRLHNITGYEQVFVDCKQVEKNAATMDESSDLGWLHLDQRVTLQASSGDGDYTWGFDVLVDGRLVKPWTAGQHGEFGANGGDTSHPHQIVFARTLSAKGHVISDFPCQGVGEHLRRPNPTAGFRAGLYNRQSPPWAAAIAVGRWVLVVVVLLGAAAWFLEQLEARQGARDSDRRLPPSGIAGGAAAAMVALAAFVRHPSAIEVAFGVLGAIVVAAALRRPMAIGSGDDGLSVAAVMLTLCLSAIFVVSALSLGLPKV